MKQVKFGINRVKDNQHFLKLKFIVIMMIHAKKSILINVYKTLHRYFLNLISTVAFKFFLPMTGSILLEQHLKINLNSSLNNLLQNEKTKKLHEA
jgi:hypothetical protein